MLTAVLREKRGQRLGSGACGAVLANFRDATRPVFLV